MSHTKLNIMSLNAVICVMLLLIKFTSVKTMTGSSQYASSHDETEA